MKQRIFSAVLALCLCISSQTAYAHQEDLSLPENRFTEESADESDIIDNEVTDDEVTDNETDNDETIGNDANDDETTSNEADDDKTNGNESDDGETNINEANDDETDGWQEDSPLPEDVLTEKVDSEADSSNTESTDIETDNQQQSSMQRINISVEELFTGDNASPDLTKVYKAMTAMKDKNGFQEGTTWTDDEPYSDSLGYYHWKGGTINGKNISAVGCVAFAFILSDAAFGSLPARMYAAGEFSFEEIKVGDILRMNTDTHTVIVLEVSNVGVVVAEGNISTGDHKGRVHWGRTISRETVMNDTSHYITRYPTDYISPDDPEADTSIAGGTLSSGLSWNLTKAGTLTISGQGAMPDFDSASQQPWSDNGGQIRKIVIEDGVTDIGSCAFWNCKILSAEIPSSVTAIGSNAFRGSSIISITIPSGVKTIGDSAFRKCQSLSSVEFSEGTETIEQNAFRSCTSLTSIALPSSIEAIGSGTFFDCTSMRNAAFAPGSRQVKLGDNIFTECHWLMSVTLPLIADRIGAGMFQNCLMLAGVEIPQGVESIENSAFASSAVSVAIIPDSVTTIGTAAFADCPLTDIYFTGTEAQWNRIGKTGDTAAAVSKATIHYNYTPADSPDDGNTGNGSGNNTGSGNSSIRDDFINSSGDSTDNDTASGTGSAYNRHNPVALSIGNSVIKTVTEIWEPATPDEKKRYECMGKESVQYTLPKDNVCQISIENAMQGPMCFASFEAVLGDYTIGRTYNIYAVSDTTYSTDEEVQLTIKIPSAIYKREREYKMICVTKGGKPFIYDDLDNNPETITIKTNKFYAYALVYGQK